MTTNTIEIVDRGRGPQLSTNRITVQDLVPYFQDKSAPDEILRWMPALTAQELAVAQRYYADHRAELDEEDKQIRAYVAEQIRLQRLRFPEESQEIRLARMRRKLEEMQRERNGAGLTCRQ